MSDTIEDVMARGRRIIALLEDQIAGRDTEIARLRTAARQVEACWLTLLAAEVRACGGIPASAVRVSAEREALAVALADLCWQEPETSEDDAEEVIT